LTTKGLNRSVGQTFLEIVRPLAIFKENVGTLYPAFSQSPPDQKSSLTAPTFRIDRAAHSRPLSSTAVPAVPDLLR
jgi:hypothetical protein